MNPIFVAAAEMQQLWRAQSWRACFIGGLAVLRWGEPRLTRDGDLTIVTGLGGEGEVITCQRGSVEAWATRRCCGCAA